MYVCVLGGRGEAVYRGKLVVRSSKRVWENRTSVGDTGGRKGPEGPLTFKNFILYSEEF